MRGRALIGGTFAALLLVLAGDNLYRFGRLQRTANCDYTLCLRPRSLESNALENRHPVVAGRYAFFHSLTRQLRGATVTVPPYMAELAPDLARIGRVAVTVAESPMLVDPDRARALRDEAPGRVRWLHEHKPAKRWRTLHVLIDPDATDYVIAETGEPLGDLFFVPAARYAEAVRP